LGSPSPKKCVDSEWGDSKGGVSIFRFPIELKKLLRYLESKRQNSGVEINVTHVTIKAAAIAMREFPALNGRVCLQQFYRSSERPSIAYLNPSVGDYLSATLVDNADLKAVDTVARELKSGVESAMVSWKIALHKHMVCT
jgi:pyruvate/2-oxoglutarate dehydrogenase complex dihydrolipoamide acyltransferase (E2) component